MPVDPREQKKAMAEQYGKGSARKQELSAIKQEATADPMDVYREGQARAASLVDDASAAAQGTAARITEGARTQLAQAALAGGTGLQTSVIGAQGRVLEDTAAAASGAAGVASEAAAQRTDQRMREIEDRRRAAIREYAAKAPTTVGETLAESGKQALANTVVGAGQVAADLGGYGLAMKVAKTSGMDQFLAYKHGQPFSGYDEEEEGVFPDGT